MFRSAAARRELFAALRREQTREPEAAEVARRANTARRTQLTEEEAHEEEHTARLAQSARSLKLRAKVERWHEHLREEMGVHVPRRLPPPLRTLAHRKPPPAVQDESVQVIALV